MPLSAEMNRREFVRGVGTCSVAVAGGVVLGRPVLAEEAAPVVETNLEEFMKVPRAPTAIPGPFPGRVVQVTHPRSWIDGKVDAAVVKSMLEEGIGSLTGKSLKKAFKLLFSKEDIVGIKPNPVGAPVIHTNLEIIDGLISWLTDCGLPKKNIILWDRFDHMLTEAGFTKERFPGVGIEALQEMGDGENWRDSSGRHRSADLFDQEAYYLAKGVLGKGVRNYGSDEEYLEQHVFAEEYSYFGKLITKRLTKIINVPVFKNAGAGISMATKNLGYSVICNTGRLHQPLFFRVCTEVLAAPWVRDKLVLNITDGLRCQYDGGPMGNGQFVVPHRSLYFATDPFALDYVCTKHLNAVRQSAGATVNESPRLTQYLFDAEKLGLGQVSDDKRSLLRVDLT